MKTLQILLVLLFAVTIAGCESRYRYACQNPDNWNAEECQKPACEASGTCPDQLTGRVTEEPKVEPSESTDCNNDIQGEG